MKRLLFLIVLSWFFSCQTSIKPKGEVRPEINYYAPNFRAIDSSNNYKELYQSLGKVTILDFWASWCRPCRESANPYYLKLYKKYHARGLNIVGVSSDRHMYFWEKALKQDSLPWENLLDSTHLILPKYKVNKIPMMFVLNKNGKIIAINIWGEKLEKTIDSLL